MLVVRENDYAFYEIKFVKILATIAIILFKSYIHYEGVGILLVGDVKELVPLLRIAARGRGEETVSVPELKLAVAKALRILIAKLDTKSQTSKENIICQDTTSLTNDQQNKWGQ
jgi:hypothetical protein